MKKWFLLLFLSIVAISIHIEPGYAATIGNPLDLDVPTSSAILKQRAVNQALDQYEETVKIKASLDLEFMFDKDLHTTREITNAEIEGRYNLLKLSTTVFNKIEPYVKIGTCDMEARWAQGNGVTQVDLESGSGSVWGVGLKGIIWEFENLGLRLTGDLQYRKINADIDSASVDGAGVSEKGSEFDIEEWQLACIVSKKFEVPLRWRNIYIVPYTGLTVSDSTVDISLSHDPGTAYTLFEANNDSIYGAVLGCDIMPSLKSSFIYSIEARLMNETALTLGGTMKF